MLDPEVADTAGFDLSVIDSVLDCLPTLQPLCFPSIWAVQEEQVYIPKAALLDRLFDGLARGFVGCVRRKLRCEMDIFALQRGGVLFARKKGENRFADLMLVVVHLCRVDTGHLHE